MKHPFFILVIAGLVLFVSSLFTSCKENPTDIGINLQPGSDKIIVATDSLAVFTKTVKDSSLSTDERSANLLGSYQNETFGLTNASFISQVTISAGNVSSNAVITADSMEIVLSYAGFIGDTTQNITFKLYKIEELQTPLKLDSTYYADFDVETEIINKTLLGEYTFTPAVSNKSANFIIKDENFLSFFSNTEIYKDDTTFLNSFPGFYFETVSTTDDKGCIAYFNLKSGNSKMIMHYNDSLKYDFKINEKCVRFNTFHHDYTTASAELQNTIAHPETNNELAYIQSAAGLKVELRIADTAKMNNLIKKGINKAQLQISIPAESFDKATTPEQLTLIYKNDNNRFEFLSDYKASTKHFGGSFNKDDNSYTFNIPLYLQDIINGQVKLENYLSLFSLDNRITANHCILYGGAHPEHPMQIKIISSEY